MSDETVRLRRPSIQRLSIIKPPKLSDIGVGINDPKRLSKRILLNLAIVFFSVFLDMMGVSVVQPILPFYAKKFNANSLQLGALYSSYSGAAAISIIIMGRVSDRYGRRKMVMFSLFGTMVGFFALGLSNNYIQLLLFRIFTGSFGGTYALAQAYVTDVVPENVRPKYLALCGAVVAIAFIFGPVIGSGLSEFGLRIPFFVSSAMGLCGLTFAYFFLQESLPRIVNKRKEKLLQKQRNKKIQQQKSQNSGILQTMDEENSEMDKDFIDIEDRDEDDIEDENELKMNEIEIRDNLETDNLTNVKVL